MMKRRIKYSVASLIAALLTTTSLGLTASAVSAQTTKTIHYATKRVCETLTWKKSMPQSARTQESIGLWLGVSSDRVTVSWKATAGWTINFPDDIHLISDQGINTNVPLHRIGGYNDESAIAQYWNSGSVTACHMVSTAPAALTLAGPAKLKLHQVSNLVASLHIRVAGRSVYLQVGNNWTNVLGDNSKPVHGITNKLGRVVLQLPASYTLYKGNQFLRAVAPAIKLKGKKYPLVVSPAIALMII